MLLNVGMPGVGLGGIFYVVGALAMPFVELARATRARLAGTPRTARDRRWGLALRQAAIALAVLAGAWAIGLGIVRLQRVAVVAPTAPIAGSAATRAPVRAGTLALGAGLLAFVLVAIELATFVVIPRRGRPRVDGVVDDARRQEAA